MRVAASFLMFGLMAACTDDGGPPPLPNDQVRAYFPSGAVANAIEVDATNRLPLRSAELVAPEGQTTPASYLHVNADPSITYYQRFFNTPYVGNAVGIGDFTLGTHVPPDIGGAAQGSISLLAMVSTASIPLPDEVAYRRDWRSYRIFLSFGDLAGEAERQVLPAPEPPPIPAAAPLPSS
jgi:hypothetical protein